MTAAVATPQVRRVAEAVAAFGLRGDAGDPRTPAIPLGRSDWASLLATCRVERTIGLLVAALSAGHVRATEAQMEEAETAHAALMGRTVLLEQVLVAASNLLSGAGVDHRVLKGSAYAWLDWADPSLRTFSDIDILLAGDYESGLRALESGGCQRSSVEVHRGFDRRFGKSTTMVEPDGHEVDVHRTLAAGAYGLLIKRDELLEGGDGFELGGCHLIALARPQRLVHACYHAALGGGQARHAMLRDVGELLLRSESSEQRRTIELARSWDGLAPTAISITSAATLLRLPVRHPLVRWAGSYQPTTDERRRLRAYCGDERSFAAQAFEGWRVLPLVRDRLVYTAQLLFPDPAHLRARPESLRHRWARGMSLVRQLGRR